MSLLDFLYYTTHTLADQIRQAAKQSQRLIAVLPTGAVEQHGPWLPLGTDSLISEAVARQVMRQLPAASEGRYSAVLLPCLHYTHARSGANFPGTVSVSPELTRQMFREICQALIQSGHYQAIVALNSHGPNFPSLTEVAFNLVFDQCDQKKTLLCPVLVLNTYDKREQFAHLLGIPQGKHGDWLEFLLVYKILGLPYFQEVFQTDEVLAEMKQAIEQAHAVPPEPMLLGVPIEERSFKGILGIPFPPCETAESLTQMAEDYWDFTCRVVMDKLLQALADTQAWLTERPS